MKTKSTLRSLPLATALAALLSTQSANALDGIWLGNSGNWNEPATWSDGTVADGTGFTANFTGVNIGAAQTITLTAPQTIGNVTFTDATTSSHNLTIDGANILTLDIDSGTPAINVTQADRTLSISSEVAGNDGLTKSGPGILSLSGANTYSGVTNITAGRLAASSLGALGGTSGITIGGASAATLSSGATGLIIAAPITTANAGVSSTLAFGVAASAAGSFTLNGAIGGNGNVIHTTVGTSNNNLQTINLGVAGNYAGSTTITSGTAANSMFVKAGVDDAMPSTTVLTIDGGNGSGSGRVSAYDLNGFNQTLAGLTNITGRSLRAQRMINTNAITLSTLTVNNASNFSYSGTIGGSTNVGVAANNVALMKSGTGTFSIGASSPYTGATNILGGTLRLFSGGAITASSGITINGSTAKLLQENTVTAIAPTVNLTQGTLTGSGTVNTVSVGDNTGGIISNNNGVAGAALTIGALTFNGAATVNTFSSSTAAPIVTTSLSSDVAGIVTINPSAAAWAPGTYDLISYGSMGGTGGFARFALGTVTGASARQGPALDDSGTAITLTVGADDPPYWVGNGDGKWNLASVNNWRLTSNNSTTAFLATDNVLFNDSATGAGPVTVDIDVADVSPSSTTFDSSKDYVLQSSGTFGIATGSLTKNGSGSLTLKTANTFTGGTAINAGTLRLGDGGTAGSLSPASAITVAAGATFAVNQSDTVTQGTDFGAISGDGGFAQTGSGTTQLDLVNTFTGATTIASGNLQIGAAGQLGGGTYAGDIGIAAGSSLQYASSATQTFSGIISGQGSLEKTGSGILTLSGTNTYQGSTAISGGTLNLGNLEALGSTSTISMADGAILRPTIDGVEIDVPITLGGTGTTTQINGPFTASAGGTVETLVLNGAIIGGGDLRLFSSTANSNTNATILLNAQSTYSGSTKLDTAGETVHLAGLNLFVKLGIANALPTATVLTLDGNVGRGSGRTVSFDLNGFNQELAGLASITTRVARNQRVTNTGSLATLKINSSSDSAYGGAGPASTYNGNPVNPTAKIVGTLALTKTGTAKFTLLGTHEYTGDTTVSEGILSLSADNSFNDASTVTIVSGATLDLNFSGTDKVNRLFIGTTQMANGIYGSEGSGAQIEIAQITGAGTLTVAPGGYAAWALTNAGGEGPELDSDKDSVSNGVEFFMNAPAGFTANPQLDGTNTITWPNGGNIPASAYGTQFVVQTSSDLLIWTDVPVGSLTTNSNGPGGSLTYTLTGGAPRFVRLKVTPN